MASKKEQCKAIMKKIFGSASASTVDDMSEEECVAKCRLKVSSLLGAERAKEFDNIV